MMPFIQIALQPFQFTFMQQAFLISIVVAIPMALLSCFLVLKGWSLMGDATSHAVLPGIVLAYVMGLPLEIGAFAAGMICATATGYLKENSRIKEDTILGVVFSGMFGLGLVLFVSIHTEVHLNHILFGNMLGVSWAEVMESAFIALVCCTLILMKRKDLILFVFDPQHAQAIGLPTRVLHYGLLAILSLTIVGALQAVGIILAVAMLVSPGAIAFLLTRQFGTMLFSAVLIATGAAFLGTYASFFIDSAPAPTIVLLMSVMFIVVFVRQQIQYHALTGSNARH